MTQHSLSMHPGFTEIFYIRTTLKVSECSQILSPFKERLVGNLVDESFADVFKMQTKSSSMALIYK